MADEELRVSGSWDGDLEAALARLDRRLGNLEDRLDDAGRAGERAGDRISEGADDATTGLRRTEAAAEDAAEQLDDVQTAAERSARTLADTDRRSRDAARGLRELEQGAEGAQEALDDVEDSAQDAARAVDDAGDEAAESGAQAAAASRGWGRLTAALERNERMSRMWQRTQTLFRWSTYTDQVDRYRQSWERVNRFDWGGMSKQVGKLATKLGGAGRAWKVFTGLLKLAAVYAAVGVLSALAAGAVVAATELVGLGRALGAVIPVILAGKLAMVAWKQAAEAVAPELDTIKKRFEGIGEAVADGGLRKGLRILNADMGQFVKLTYDGFGLIGGALGRGAERLGLVAKNGERLKAVERIFAGMDDILDRMIGTALHLGEALLTVTEAGTPAAIRMTGDIEEQTRLFRDWLDVANRSGDLTRWIDAGYTQLRNTVMTLTDYIVALYNIFKIANGVSGGFGKSITENAQAFRDWTESLEGGLKIRKYFEDAMPAFRESMLLVGAFLKLLLMIPAAEGTAPLLNQLRTEFLPALGEAIAKISGQGGLLPSVVSAGTELAKMFTQLDLSAITFLAQAFADLVAWLTQTIATVPGLSWLVSTFALLWVVGGAALSVISGGMAAFAWIRGAATLTGTLTLAQTILGNTLYWLRYLFMALTGTTSVWAGVMYLATLPITWIIIAIVALVAAFIWAYNNVEWFRVGVDAVISAVGGFFVWLWKDVIVPAWDGIVNAITTAWNDFIFPVFNAIWTIIKIVGAVIFTLLVAPFVIAWNILTALFTWAYEAIILPVLTAIGDQFAKLAAWWDQTYHTYIAPILQFFADKLNWLNMNVVQPVLGWISDRWNDLAFGMKVANDTVLTPMLQFVGDKINWLNLNVVQPVLGWIGDRWSEMATGFQIVKQAVIDPVFNAMGDGLNQLGEWFRSTVDNIGRIWNDLRTKLAVPINFVIDKVWNNGILAVWNWVAEKLGLPKGQPIAPIPEYATGGAIRGPGTGTSDSIYARLSNGEHVLTAREVQMMGGHQQVEQMRRAARIRGRRGVQAYLAYGGEKPMQFADGGAVERGQGWAAGEAGKPYVWGGVGPGGYDCSGFISALTNFVTRSSPVHRRIFATGSFSKNRGAGGFMPGLGSAFAIGVSPNTGSGIGHMAGTIGGMNVESRGGRGTLVGSSARGADDRLFPWQFSLPQAGGEFSSGGGGGWTWDIAKAALDAIINPVINAIPFRGPPQFMDIPKRMAETARDSMYGWAQTKLESIMSFFGGGSGGDPHVRTAVQQMAERFGWGGGAEWSALDKLIQKESSWNPAAANPRSSARGLFQKMTSIHGPLEPSVAGQAAWGLNYIKGKYGSPSRAWGFHQAHNWYDEGGMLPPGPSLVMNGTGHPEPVFNGPQWGVMSGILDTTAALLEPAPASDGGTDPELVAAMQQIAAALAHRPPDVHTTREDVRREVAAALRQQRREDGARGRYSYAT